MGLRTGPQSGPYTGTPGGAPPAGGGSGVLEVNQDTMVSSQQYVHDVADLIYGQITRLMSTIETLSGHWRSTSGSAYNNAMNNWNTAATNLRKALYDIGDGLGQSHKVYNEQELTNKLGIDKAAANLPY